MTLFMRELDEARCLMPKKSNLPVEVLLPGGQIEAYVQAVSQIPILTAEEEKEIADRLYYDNDLDASYFWIQRIRNSKTSQSSVISGGPIGSGERESTRIIWRPATTCRYRSSNRTSTCFVGSR